jgi:hypothetical protein
MRSSGHSEQSFGSADRRSSRDKSADSDERPRTELRRTVSVQFAGQCHIVQGLSTIYCKCPTLSLYLTHRDGLLPRSARFDVRALCGDFQGIGGDDCGVSERFPGDGRVEVVNKLDAPEGCDFYGRVAHFAKALVSRADLPPSLIDAPTQPASADGIERLLVRSVTLSFGGMMMLLVGICEELDHVRALSPSCYHLRPPPHLTPSICKFDVPGKKVHVTMDAVY